VIGGQDCRVIVMIPPDPKPCTCGSIDALAALVCASHRTLLDGEIVSMFAALAGRAQEARHTC